MSRKIQQNLFEQIKKRGPKPRKPADHFGGIYHQNYNPKSKRPMDSKKALHVVMRSTQAKGVKSFKSVKYEAAIWEIISRHAERFGIKIYEYANAGNHLHILLRAKHRDEFKAFIRTISGLIARLVGGAQRNNPLKKKFWDARPFSRVVSFAKREFDAAKSYLHRNIMEVIGWMPYVPRDQRLPAKWRQWLTPTIASG
jgi:REP element-mobilizing transposase RayT